MRRCHFCGAPLDDSAEVFRASTCDSCGKDLKICLNCRFYSPGAHWDCAEPLAEQVVDKERSNFCDYFRFREASGGGASGRDRAAGGGGAKADRSQKAKKDFRRLFGDGS
jgi:hypothetical protein